METETKKVLTESLKRTVHMQERTLDQAAMTRETHILVEHVKEKPILTNNRRRFCKLFPWKECTFFSGEARSERMNRKL